jgi:hypothetical protein
MAELLEAVVSWPNMLLVLLVFGFAPGFCLRLIVLAYPRGDPRRSELIAELYAVPRIQRPLWVAEQLETALFEGLPHRLSPVLRWVARQGRARAMNDLVVGLVAGLWVGLRAVRARAGTRGNFVVWLVIGLVAGLGVSLGVLGVLAVGLADGLWVLGVLGVGVEVAAGLAGMSRWWRSRKLRDHRRAWGRATEDR